MIFRNRDTLIELESILHTGKRSKQTGSKTAVYRNAERQLDLYSSEIRAGCKESAENNIGGKTNGTFCIRVRPPTKCGTNRNYGLAGVFVFGYQTCFETHLAPSQLVTVRYFPPS